MIGQSRIGMRNVVGRRAIYAYSLFTLFFFAVPLLTLFLTSLRPYELGRPLQEFTLDNFRTVLFDSEFMASMGRSLSLAFRVSSLCLLLGVGAVLGSYENGHRTRRLVPLACAIMFFTGVIPRTFALAYVLSGHGPLQNFWGSVGLPDGLVYTGVGVVIGQLPVVLPLSVLALYVARTSVAHVYSAAANDLGAGWWSTQCRVVLPLMKPGLIVAFILPFVLVFADVVVVDLIGGSQVYTVGLFIVDYVKIDDWGLAAAAAVIVLAFLSIILAIAGWWTVTSVQKWQRS